VLTVAHDTAVMDILLPRPSYLRLGEFLRTKLSADCCLLGLSGTMTDQIMLHEMTLCSETVFLF